MTCWALVLAATLDRIFGRLIFKPHTELIKYTSDIIFSKFLYENGCSWKLEGTRVQSQTNRHTWEQFSPMASKGDENY